MRDPELKNNWGTICTLVELVSSDGKKHKEMTADQKGMFRIIQSIPSPKAEPFKQWMAQVASDRLDQMQNPELSIDQAIADYKRLGYSDKWITQRVKGIEVRKELTDEWDRAGVQQGQQYASLTGIITKEWSGMTRVRGQSLIRFCLGTAAGLRPAVTHVSPLERLQRS